MRDLSAVRRRVAWLAAGMSVVGAAGFLSVSLNQPAPKRSSLTLVEPTPTPTVQSTPGPEPTAARVPVASPGPSASTAGETTAPPSRRPTPTPRATPTCGGDSQKDCPDGKPGWSDGFDSCTVTTALEPGGAGKPPAPGVTAELVPPSSSVKAGTRFEGVLKLTNTSDADLTFSLSHNGSGFQADVLGPVGGAIFTTDVMVSDPVKLPAGSSTTRKVAIATTTCGDTVDDASPPLPAGKYGASLSVYYHEVTVVAPTPSPDPSSDTHPSTTPSPRPAPDSFTDFTVATTFAIT